MRLPKSAALLVSTALAALVSQAAPASIGMAVANGYVTVDHAKVWGNVTLFEGTAVETGANSSVLSLTGGVRLQLAAGSRVAVWDDHAVLEQGAGQLLVPRAYQIETLGFRVSAPQGSSLTFGLTPDRSLKVASLAGTVMVRDAKGIATAIRPGSSRVFAMQQETEVSGCLLVKDGRFIIQDDTTTAVSELSGPDLRANVGNRVSISGTVTGAAPNVTLATQVINVTNVAPVSPGGCLTIAAGLDASITPPAQNAAATPAGAKPAAPTAPRPASSGMSAGAKTAIVLAIAGGGGAGAALALSGKKKSTSP